MSIQEIKQYMKKNKITYDELARRTGLSKSCITKIFAGIARYPRVDTMQAIERALGLAPEWTDRDAALGVTENAPVVLSDTDRYRLNTLARAEEVLGIDYVNGVLSIIEITIENKNKK